MPLIRIYLGEQLKTPSEQTSFFIQLAYSSLLRRLSQLYLTSRSTKHCRKRHSSSTSSQEYLTLSVPDNDPHGGLLTSPRNRTNVSGSLGKSHSYSSINFLYTSTVNSVSNSAPCAPLVSRLKCPAAETRLLTVSGIRSLSTR